jgi:hypothetical protein
VLTLSSIFFTFLLCTLGRIITIIIIITASRRARSGVHRVSLHKTPFGPLAQ